jgi:hypothetical protein
MRPLRRSPVRRPVPPVRVMPVPRHPTSHRAHTAPPTSTAPEQPVTTPALSAARTFILTVADWNDLEPSPRRSATAGPCSTAISATASQYG